MLEVTLSAVLLVQGWNGETEETLVPPSSTVPNLVQVAQEGVNLFCQSSSQSVHPQAARRKPHSHPAS